jgi:RNA polymerase sigma-70 factor (ECF subfamily)
MADGDRAAFADLFERHSRNVFAYLLNRGVPAANAEDAVQEAFLSAWKSASGFYEGSAAGWLRRIAHRRAVDLERDQHRRRALADRLNREYGGPADAPSAEECLLASSPRYTALAVALAELSADQRTVIELRYVHRLTTRETAERLGVPEGTVKARAARGCAQLRRWLEERKGGEDDEGTAIRVPRPRA